ncbi:MAG: 2-succinyl-5-enolpyruvyl-6-hydroxy-3-cyclohexene-carboxylate synthase [Actinomycetota bacterium]
MGEVSTDPALERLATAAPADVQATFCATLVDQWIRMGMQHAVVSPGSRSTPMALALADRPEIGVHVAIDERSASFIALGIASASGVPAALLCTSGTAAAHFHAAVVEADLSGVPMLVLTADRPPELHGVGAPQTIDQFELYGDVVRVFASAEVPDARSAHEWRALAAEIWWATLGDDSGPVHLNLPFREPLVGSTLGLPTAGELDAHDVIDGASTAGEWFASPVPLEELAISFSGKTGLVVAGRGIADVSGVARLSETLGWPVFADPRSGCRSLPTAVCAFDPIVRAISTRPEFQPDVVLHLGEQPASKVLGQWMQARAAAGAEHVHVFAPQRIIDPAGIVTARVYGEPGAVCSAIVAEGLEPAPASWLARWTVAEAAAQTALDAAFSAASDGSPSEPMVARALSARDGVLVVSSSMPVRDVEWFGVASSTTVLSNRGANGIDGVIASAIGAAIGSGQRTTLLIGDVAFCHDLSSLVGLSARGLDLTIVVVDNDGGGIFSFLPQRGTLGADRFEQLFGTPHGTDLIGIARAHGLGARTAHTMLDLQEALDDRECVVVRIVSDRDQNVIDHDALHAAVAAAITA